MAFSSLADLVKHFESSGGDYTAVNPKSGASGAYQFVGSTWRAQAKAAGVDTSQYPTAADAPPAVQDQVFQQMVSTNGLRDYTCDGCNPALASYVSSHQAEVAGLPIFSGDNSTAGGATPTLGSDGSPLGPSESDYGSSEGTNPLVDTNITAPGSASGTQTAAAGSSSSGGSATGLPQIFGSLGNWVIRGGLIFLGIVLVGGAAYVLAEGEMPSGQRILNAVKPP